MVTLRVEGPDSLDSLIRDLTTLTGVSTVELVGRDYTTQAAARGRDTEAVGTGRRFVSASSESD